MGIQNGSKVGINYAVSVDGVMVDSSDGRGPLTYTQGAGEIVPGLESQLMGLNVGDKKQVTVSPEEAYGMHDPQAVKKVPREAFGDTEGLEVGSVVQGTVGDRAFQATVVGIEATEITLDLNHPLAGKTLNFEIEVVSVEG